MWSTSCWIARASKPALQMSSIGPSRHHSVVSTILLARSTSAVIVGKLRQPSLATVLSVERSSLGFTIETRPLVLTAARCDLTSTTATWTNSPTWLAASPTHPGCARIVSTRSSSSARARALSTGSHSRLSTGSGKVTTWRINRTARRVRLEVG